MVSLLFCPSPFAHFLPCPFLIVLSLPFHVLFVFVRDHMFVLLIPCPITLLPNTRLRRAATNYAEDQGEAWNCLRKTSGLYVPFLSSHLLPSSFLLSLCSHFFSWNLANIMSLGCLLWACCLLLSFYSKNPLSVVFTFLDIFTLLIQHVNAPIFFSFKQQQQFSKVCVYVQPYIWKSFLSSINESRRQWFLSLIIPYFIHSGTW